MHPVFGFLKASGKPKALVAGIVTGSGSLPIYWRVVAKKDLTLHQNSIEECFILALKKILPSHYEVVVLADWELC